MHQRFYRLRQLPANWFTVDQSNSLPGTRRVTEIAIAECTGLYSRHVLAEDFFIQNWKLTINILSISHEENVRHYSF